MLLDSDKKHRSIFLLDMHQINFESDDCSSYNKLIFLACLALIAWIPSADLPLPLCPAWSPEGYCISCGACPHYVVYHFERAPITPENWIPQGPMPRSRHSLIRGIEKKKVYRKHNNNTAYCGYRAVTPTCSIWCRPDIGGKHFDTGLLVGCLRQASVHLLTH